MGLVEVDDRLDLQDSVTDAYPHVLFNVFPKPGPDAVCDLGLDLVGEEEFPARERLDLGPGLREVHPRLDLSPIAIIGFDALLEKNPVPELADRRKLAHSLITLYGQQMAEIEETIFPSSIAPRSW